MAGQQENFESLVAQVRAGSEEAVWTLIEQYGPHILRTVRRRLARDLRSKFDSQDFVQAVWASFFSGSRQFARLETPDQLMAFLTAMARNKVVDEVRRRVQTQKHDLKRERSLDDSTAGYRADAASREPTPSDVAIAREQWERILAAQPEHYRRIVELRLTGETHDRIALELGINERTVRRVLGRMLEERVA
jgi:RNA polymerase sigma factor (sigma-70 family)